MYPPKHHQTNDQQKMISVIQQYPLAMLVSVIDGKPLITHLPIIYNKDKLVGHIDKNNPQVESLQSGKEVSIVFKGPDAYISPSIYTTKQLPTWNYIMVHLTGKVYAITSLKEVKQTLAAMTFFLEAPNHNYVLEMDNPKIDVLSNYIHVFEIEITNWEGKFKLSQDKCVEDQKNAREQLLKGNQNNINLFFDKIFN